MKKILPFLLLLFIVTGCTNANGAANKSTEKKPVKTTINQQLKEQNKIKKFSSLNDFKKFLKDNTSNESPIYGKRNLMSDSAMPTTESLVKTDAAGKGSANNDFSQTNIQVEGVDEADIVKTDGKYVYAVSDNNLSIIDAYPGEQAKTIANIKFESTPEEIYLKDNYLVVYGYDNLVYAQPFYKTFRRQNSYAFFKIFDISDKKNPKQIKDLKFEGQITNSRLINDYVYLTTTNYNYYPAGDIILPRVIENDKVISSEKSSDKYLVPDIYYFNLPYNNINLTSLVSINIKDSNKAINSQVYLMPGGENMYVSQHNIYLTYSKYLSEYQILMAVSKDLIFPKLPKEDQTKIAKIESIDKFILSDQEKAQKINYIIENYKNSLDEKALTNYEKNLESKMKERMTALKRELEKTVIHKIAINNEKLEYKGTAEVTGTLLNQFSMDEQNGFFRIATTKNQSWSEFTDENDNKSDNNLYVFDENLKQISSLEKLAQGERIYSVRFMQNRAYLVTFKQVDPLFVIDLSDNRNPKIMGELKIPGFSQYLHPYDNETLIGIGKETEQKDNNTITSGLKISLFNVADPQNPKELTSYKIGYQGSDSLVLNDHKAFLFSKEKNLLVIPAYLTKKSSDSWGNVEFNGALVFNITNKSIDLKGKISHKKGETDKNGWYDYYRDSVKRSLYINDNLYTLSNNYLKINKINNLESLKEINLDINKNNGDDFKIVN